MAKSKSLYEIDEQILACIDEETGEIFDVEKFEALSIERDSKIESLCLLIKNYSAEAEALKAEKQSFAKRQKTAENTAERLKKYVSDYLNGTKFKTTKVSVSYRKSESLEVAEGAVVPEEFLRYSEPEVKKDDLKAFLKSGGHVDGVSIKINNNIQIR